jgi:hypothetical protein
MIENQLLNSKKDLLNLENHIIKYRDCLNIKQDITFGTEIEFDNARMGLVLEKLYENNLTDWVLERDGSVTRGDGEYNNGHFYDGKNNFEIKMSDSKLIGGEVISPILKDNYNTWNNLKKVCEIVKDCDAIASDKTGAHIHIGSQIINDTDDEWITFILLWIAYEKIIFKFSYGMMTEHRPNIKDYAKPIGLHLYNNLDYLKDGLVRSKLMKMATFSNNGISFAKTKFPFYSKNNTIEIRCPNGTLDPIIWQNNINFFIKLFSSVRENRVNRDALEKKLYEDKPTTDLNLYKQTYAEDAYELADIIFDNDIDKPYFFIQYFKLFSSEQYGSKKTYTRL